MTHDGLGRSPGAGDRGAAGLGIDAVRNRVLPAWGALCSAALHVDLEMPSYHDAFVALGAWPDNRNVGDLMAEARDHEPADRGDPATLAKRVAHAHADASPAEVRGAIERQRAQLDAALIALDGASYCHAPVITPLGPLPLLTYLHATAYAVACALIHVEAADAATTDAGLVALLDTIGALAKREGATASVGAITPTVSAATWASPAGWILDPDYELAGDPPAARSESRDPVVPVPLVHASTQLLLEVTIGRVDIAGILRRGDLRVTDARGLLALVPVVEAVPQLPGRGPLLAAVRTAQTVTSIWDRLKRW